MPTELEWSLSPITKGSLRYGDPTPSKEDLAIEKEWGNNQNNQTNNGNWTTKLGERIVKEKLESLGITVWKPTEKQGLRVDWETPNFMVEVKTRSWTTSGTAGEKVLGVPYKYSEVPELYGKPLLIVCVAYQEWELSHVDKMKVFGKVSPSKQKMIDLWSDMGITFVPFTQLESHV